MCPGSTGDMRKAALAALVNCRNPPVQQPVVNPAFLGCDLKINAGVISDCLEMIGKCVCLQYFCVPYCQDLDKESELEQESLGENESIRNTQGTYINAAFLPSKDLDILNVTDS